MRKNKKGFDALLLIAIIATSLGLLGGLAFANLPYVNFSPTTKTSGQEGNAYIFNLFDGNFIEKAFVNENEETEVSIYNAVEYLLAGWVAITATLAVAMLMVGAFLYITAHGNDEQMNKAKQYITLTILGLVVASLAYLIVRVVVGALYG